MIVPVISLKGCPLPHQVRCSVPSPDPVQGFVGGGGQALKVTDNAVHDAFRLERRAQGKAGELAQHLRGTDIRFGAGDVNGVGKSLAEMFLAAKAQHVQMVRAVPDIERIAGKCVHSGPWLTCEKHPAFRGVRKLYSHGEIVGIEFTQNWEFGKC